MTRSAPSPAGLVVVLSSLLPACGTTDVVADLLVDAGGAAEDGAQASDADPGRTQVASDAGAEHEAVEADGGTSAGPSGQPLCLGDLAARVFPYVACSCADTLFQTAFTIDSFDSADGPYNPLAPIWKGSVGTNGAFHAENAIFTIGGDLIVADARGLVFAVAATVMGDLRVGGPLNLMSAGTVGKDLWLGGDVKGAGYLIVGGDAIQTAGAQRDALVALDITGSDRREPLVSVPPPCRCDDQALDVGALVTEGKRHAQNAALGFDTDSLASITTPRRMELPPGWLSVSKIDATDALTLVVRGNTALFVAGDVRITGASFALELAAQAELDLIIGGDLQFATTGEFGAAARPQAVRAYVAGQQPITFDSQASLAGNLYAPHADASFLGLQDIFGSIEAKSIVVEVGNLHYDLATARSTGGCAP